jgi:DNA repair protein RecO (recombination protein O)
MLVQTKALVLKSIKYQDNSLIVNCYTQQLGLLSFFVPNAYSSNKKKQKAAYFLPLNLLEIHFVYKQNKTLNYFKEIRTSTPLISLHYEVEKNALVLFLAEMLNNTLQESGADADLFSFIEKALIWLDSHEQIAHFHLLVLLKITRYLGFYPDFKYNTHPYFNLLQGRFVSNKEHGCLSEEESFLFAKLYELENNSTFILRKSDRNKLLQLLIRYYENHIENFKKPKSLEVLIEVFA